MFFVLVILENQGSLRILYELEVMSWLSLQPLSDIDAKPTDEACHIGFFMPGA